MTYTKKVEVAPKNPLMLENSSFLQKRKNISRDYYIGCFKGYRFLHEECAVNPVVASASEENDNDTDEGDVSGQIVSPTLEKFRFYQTRKSNLPNGKMDFTKNVKTLTEATASVTSEVTTNNCAKIRAIKCVSSPRVNRGNLR